MLTLQRTLSLGYLKQRWLRALLVVLSIALGVATVVATSILRGSLTTAAVNACNPLAGSADLMISNNQAGVPLAVADQLDPGKAESEGSPLAAIAHVQPMVIGRVALPENNNLSVLLLGIHLRQDALSGRTQTQLPAGLEIRWLTAEVNRLAADALWRTGLGPVPVLVSEPLGRQLGLAAGGSAVPFRVRMAGRECQAVALGLVAVSSAWGQPGPILFMPAAPAARFIYPQRPEYITRVYVTLKPGFAKEAMCRRLEQRLGPPFKVQTMEQGNDAILDITAGLELGFAVGSTEALVIGLFLVYNALSVSVAERRRDIGILRSVGATRGQIVRLIMGEALLLGVLGALLGLPAGFGLAVLAHGPISRALGDGILVGDAPALHLDGFTIGLALVAGISVTAVAALAPALQAAGAEPADVLRRSPPSRPLVYRGMQVAACLLLLGIGLACVLGRESLPLRFGSSAGIVCILLACLIATPLLALVAGRLLRPFFSLFLGLEGRLAADNLVRSPGRTGLTIAALAATGGLLIQTAGFIVSTQDAILAYLDESVAADLFVTAGAPLTRVVETMPMDESLGGELLTLPDVEAVLAIRFHTVAYRNRVVVLVALDTNAFANSEVTHRLGRNLRRYPQLRQRPGTCLVSENFAALCKVKAGDTVTIPGLSGAIDLEVLGIVVDYTWNRGTILVDRGWYRDKFRDQQVDVFQVYLKPRAGRPVSASGYAMLDRGLGKMEITYTVTRADLRAALIRQLGRVYGLAYAQQAVVGLVALLGVISALFISVLQRRPRARLAACRRGLAPTGVAVRAGGGGPDGHDRSNVGVGNRGVAGVVRT